MVASEIVASPQSSRGPYIHRLRRKRAFSNLLACYVYPPNLVQSSPKALNTNINTVQQSNRNAVIIDGTLYAAGSLPVSRMSSTYAISGELLNNVGGRKLRKPSPLLLSGEELQLVRVPPHPLSRNYLDVEIASKDATLLRMSKLSASRSTARRMQYSGAIKNSQIQGHAARSAHSYAALSSHPVMNEELVLTVPGPDRTVINTGSIAPSGRQAASLRRKRRMPWQKQRKFKPVLESTKEEYEDLDIELTQTHDIGSVERHESTTEICDRLERERDFNIGKCESLERVTDAIYENRHIVGNKFESRTGRWKSLENRIVELRDRIQNLDTKVAAERVMLDHEIGRDKDDFSQQTDKSQRVKFRVDAHTAVGQSVRSNLQIVPNSSLLDSVDWGNGSPTEDFGHALYGDMNTYRAAEYGIQKIVEFSQQPLHDMQVRSKPTADSLIINQASDVKMAMIVPGNTPLKALETGSAKLKPQTQSYIFTKDLSTTAASEALRPQIGLKGGDDSLADQQPKFLPTRRLSSPPQETDTLLNALPGLNQLPDLDSDTSSGDEDIRLDTDTRFRFGSPRVYAVPAVYRVRISAEETEQTDYEVCLVPHLNTWEWSSVPELRLRDF